MAAVELSPAHTALREAVNNLMKNRAKSLKDLKKPPTTITKFADGLEWATGLDDALKELETWCTANSPNNPFTIEVP